jgi:hypothetical protein
MVDWWRLVEERQSTAAVPWDGGGVINPKGLFLEELRVDQCELSPLLGEIILKEDGLDGADFGADTAVDALVRVDEILLGVIGRVDAVHWTDLHTAIVLDTDTWLGDHIRHGTSLLALARRAMRVRALRTRCEPHMRSSLTNSRVCRV